MTNSISTGVAYLDPQLDDAIMGYSGARAGKAGFYGKVPVVQRPYTSAVHATAALASSTDFAAAQTAVLHEVMRTLIGLGVWATA